MSLNESDRVIDVGSPVRPNEVERKRESVRQVVALTMTCGVLGLFALAIVSVIIWPDRATAIKDIFGTFGAGILGIYGTVIGFYFGGKQ